MSGECSWVVSHTVCALARGAGDTEQTAERPQNEFPSDGYVNFL